MLEYAHYLSGVSDDIAAHGWAIQGVFGDADRPAESFSYTVGMTALGLPELWVGTLDPRQCHGLLTALADKQVTAGVPLSGEVDVDWSVPFRVTGPVDLKAARAYVATALYPHPAVVTVCQVLWPDAAGRWPDDSAYDQSLPQLVLPARGEGGA